MFRILMAVLLFMLVASAASWSRPVSSDSEHTQNPPNPKSSIAPSGTCSTQAEAFYDGLAKGDPTDAMSNFDRAMRARLNARALIGIWQDLGKIQSRSRAHEAPNNDPGKIAFRLRFESSDFIATLSCGPDGKFDDFELVPLLRPLPPPDASSAFRETRVELGEPATSLTATLVMPAGQGPFPGVVLVGGAGIHDGDETFGFIKPLRDVAHGLAAHGIASLRYDKPGFDHPLAFIAKPYTIDDEYTEPALEAVAFLLATPRIDSRRVFVLGHSQGGEMAPRIALRDKSIAGLILLAAPAHTLSQYFERVRQSTDRLVRLYPQYATQIRQNAATTEATRKWLAQADPKHLEALGPDGAPASYWLGLRDYKAEVLTVAKALSQPMLILQGGRDDSVSPKEDFGAWKRALAGNSRITFKEYPTLSHLMTFVNDPPSAADYEKPVHVAPEVIDDIARWIKTQQPASQVSPHSIEQASDML